MLWDETELNLFICERKLGIKVISFDQENKHVGGLFGGSKSKYGIIVEVGNIVVKNENVAIIFYGCNQ